MHVLMDDECTVHPYREQHSKANALIGQQRARPLLFTATAPPKLLCEHQNQNSTNAQSVALSSLNVTFSSSPSKDYCLHQETTKMARGNQREKSREANLKKQKDLVSLEPNQQSSRSHNVTRAFLRAALVASGGPWLPKTACMLNLR